MSHFLAATAFRDRTLNEVADSITSYAAEHKVGCQPYKLLPDDTPDTLCDALVFAPASGWVVVIWPEYFNAHDFALAERLSSTLSGLTSSIHIYDGAYWSHALFSDGKRVDQFCSQPNYHNQSSPDPALLQAWRGSPDVIASFTQASADTLECYLVHNPHAHAKAVESDRFALSDFWVFTDFWRQLGINYPQDVSLFESCLRFDTDYSELLPGGDEL